jgi:transcriptional regulator with XRE-family HTH domain
MSSRRVTMFQGFVGANVRKLRDQRALTQRTLAKVAGLHVRYVRLIERGRMNPTLSVIVGLADALGVQPARLMREAQLQQARPGRPRSAKR